MSSAELGKKREVTMNLDSILKRVDTEQLYQHVLRLEGVKHPIDTPEKLKEAAEYIAATLEGYGLPVRFQEFRLDGWDDTFLNVEGWVGDAGAPAAVIINHYDTVHSTPGANDNAAGVAVMLEAARVLADEKDAPTVRFVSATLEEGLSPTHKLNIRRSAHRLGLTDEHHRTTSYRAARTMKRWNELIAAGIGAGKCDYDAMADAIAQLQDQLDPALLEHLQGIQDIYRGLTSASGIGVTGKIGSSKWVDEALALGKKIAFAICLDEIGTTSRQAHSQRLPPNLTYAMMQTYKVDAERQVGDWAFVIADAASGRVAQTFCRHCEHEAIDLPYSFFQMPGFEQIAAQYPQAFGSDHAPFWRAGIPAMFAFDTAGWRNPFGHSMADTIDRLDFDHITKICRAVIATTVDPALRS